MTHYAIKESGTTPYRMLNWREYRGSIGDLGEVALGKFAGQYPNLLSR